MYKDTIDFIKTLYPRQDFIPLHEPRFIGREKEYLTDAIDSTFVSSVGAYVNKFEDEMADLTGARYAVAIANGTGALHIALKLAGVSSGHEVITQAFTFVATANAISYLGAKPVFTDVSLKTMGMCPEKLEAFLSENAEQVGDDLINKVTGKKISACVPMHTYGFPCEIDRIVSVCNHYSIPVIEDAAESLGSHYKDKHTGTYGIMGTFSFNGNKTLTCGGGGAIVTDDEEIAKKAKHLTTQAKVPHRWEFRHDEIGYNYRMPNINAALACAQLEQLDSFIKNKRELGLCYADFFIQQKEMKFFTENEGSKANYWLNVLIFKDLMARNDFLDETNADGVMTRPAWILMNELDMFSDCQHDGLANSKWLEERLVNIPSSVRIDSL
ncbi:aminotransferase DegT [Roseivirga sp. 4D4]|uniref:LegC family aminotransferase n=1 Tax=Roseivirga sp. 4D4 TaxID=1889784 RepID=UPI000853C9FA|nr:LegC family aminotransferase [Roseivirga sp. 4D4]OEK01633.1 aminotransferase DegT [Roseivirga sp. 4D4]